MRASDRDPIRGEHYGQRPRSAASTGRTHGCTNQPRITVTENTCQRGANGMDPALVGRWNLERQLHSRRSAMQIVRIGLDLAKYVFEVHGVNARGKAVMRKTLDRKSTRLNSSHTVISYAV